MIFRAKKDHSYICIDNYVFERSDISWRAKGILAYLLSRPENWQVHLNDLMARSPLEGRDAIRTALKELEDAGHFQKRRIRGEKGKMSGWECLVFERPQPKTDEPTSADPTYSKYEEEPSTEGSFFQKEKASNPTSSTIGSSLLQRIKNSPTAGGGTHHPIPQPPLPKDSHCKKMALKQISISASQNALIPSSGEMIAFAETEGLQGILEHKEDIWDIWMKDKWHIWKGGRWVFRRDWKSALIKYNSKLEEYKTKNQ